MRLLHYFEAALAGCLMVTVAHAADTMDGGGLSSPADTRMPSMLSAFVRTVLDNNYKLLAARSAVDAADARARASGQPLYNPELELDAETAQDDTASLGVTQAIDWADKRAARRGVGAFEVAAARAEFEATRQSLTGELLTALGRYHTAVALDQLARQRVDLMRRFLALAEKRHQIKRYQLPS